LSRHKRRRKSASRSCSDPGIFALGDGDDAMIQVDLSIQQNKSRPRKTANRMKQYNLTQVSLYDKRL
jgi:hypothetical protein